MRVQKHAEEPGAARHIPVVLVDRNHRPLGRSPESVAEVVERPAVVAAFRSRRYAGAAAESFRAAQELDLG